MKVEERVDHEQKRHKWRFWSQDFKRKWRVTSAKKQLVQQFGLSFIRWAIAYAVVVLLALVALIVTEVTGRTTIIVEFQANVASSIEAALVVIAGIVGTLAAIVVTFKFIFASHRASNVSRGEIIFKEAASMVKDQLGFLDKVKQELKELFAFLNEFEKEVGAKIVIVPIIDDLDRCLTDGRNVKVLEAMQLILSVPGAPIISFLAVDSRIVVASIEEHHEKVFAKTNISGHEYLGKIVQIPFALPEPSPEKVERLLSKALEGNAATLEQVAQRVKSFATHGRQILTQELKLTGRNTATFKIARTKDTPEVTVPLKPLVQVIEQFWSAEQFWVGVAVELDSDKQVLVLVCAAAQKLGQHLQELAYRVRVLEDTKRDTEEAVEMLCRATNAVLEAGRFDFGDVHNVDMRMLLMV